MWQYIIAITVLLNKLIQYNTYLNHLSIRSKQKINFKQTNTLKYKIFKQVFRNTKQQCTELDDPISIVEYIHFSYLQVTYCIPYLVLILKYLLHTPLVGLECNTVTTCNFDICTCTAWFFLLVIDINSQAFYGSQNYREHFVLQMWSFTRSFDASPKQK